MPTILALDTATSDVSVAVAWDCSEVARRVAARRRTGVLLAPAVREAVAAAGLRPGDLEAVAVGVGPGPYTSLRAGITFAKATGLALGIPVIGACTLDVVARGLTSARSGSAADAVVALDARRREVYWARYDGSGRRIAGPLVGPPAFVRQANADALWWGPPVPGDDADGDAPPWHVDALELARWVVREWPVGQVASVAGGWDAASGDGGAASPIPQALLRPEPLYLRRPDAVEPTVGAVRP